MKLFLLFLFVVMVAVVVATQGNHYRNFLKTAQKTHAIITKKEDRVAEPKTKRVEHWVSYRYSVDGTDYVASVNVEYDDIWARLREGQDTMVYYSPARPQESHLELLIERRAGIAAKLLDKR